MKEGERERERGREGGRNRKEDREIKQKKTSRERDNREEEWTNQILIMPS